MSAMEVQKIYREPTPERNPGNGSNPGNLRRDARRRNTIPRRKRQSVSTDIDQNPFHETQDESFSKQYDSTQRYTNPQPNDINRVQRQYANINEEPTYQPSRVPMVRKKVKHKPAKGEIMTARLKLSAINGWVISWSTFWYVTFQLPFAFVSTAGLGMGAVVYSYLSSFAEGAISTWIINNITIIASSTSDAIANIADALFGFAFDPLILFIAPFALIFILGIFQLILVWVIYNIAGVKSLSGTRAGLKNTMFLIAGIGMFIPVLNLFPLTFLWLIIVWKYPK